MALRRQLEQTDETVSGFVLAAEQKHLEGLELALAGHYGAAIYLMGYAAEMLLKVACFRLDGAGLGDPVGPLLPPARSWGRRRFPATEDESYHSLRFWCRLLLDKRLVRGNPLPAVVRGLLVRCVRRLYAGWWIEMRYRPDQAGFAQMQGVYNDVTWLRDNHLLWWS